MTELQVVYRETNSLVTYDDNVMIHDDDQVQQLVASINEFGWTNPVLIDEESVVIAGHGRLMAASQIGIERVPTITLAGLTDAQKRAYRIADNKLPLNAKWDEELLKIELERLSVEDFDISLTGFSDKYIEELLAEKTTGLTEDDDAPDKEETAVSEPGDLWLLGRHRLLCGDSLDPDVVKRVCDNRQVDVWLTDPPYNVEYTGKTKRALKILNDKHSDEGFLTFLSSAYKAADAVMKPGGVYYIWHADNESVNFRLALRAVPWKLAQTLVWNKSILILGRSDYHWKHEPCLYGWKEGAAHLWAGGRKQSTVVEADKPLRNDIHPTMKPVELFENLVLNNTRGGDICLDSFAGSGTTIIACEKTGRNACCIELDPLYVDVIIRRWQAFTGHQAVNEKTGKTFDETVAGLEIAS